MNEAEFVMLHGACRRGPFEPPEWRWSYAGALLERGKRLRWLWPRRDAIRRVLPYRRLAARLGDPADPALARLDQELAAAHAIWADPGRALRFELEVRLLAGQDDAAIAAATGVPAGVVEAFADAFYDVRSMMKASDYIAGQVIGTHILDFEPELAAHVKLDAYFGGLAYANLWLSFLGSPPRLPEPGDDGPFEPEVAAGYRRLWAMRMLPVNEDTRLPILQMYFRWRAAQLRAEKGVEPDRNEPLLELGKLYDEVELAMYELAARPIAGDRIDEGLRATG